jgi:hypothetical protein
MQRWRHRGSVRAPRGAISPLPTPGRHSPAQCRAPWRSWWRAEPWDFAGRGQQPPIPVIGFMTSRADDESRHSTIQRRHLIAGGLRIGQYKIKEEKTMRRFTHRLKGIVALSLLTFACLAGAPGRTAAQNLEPVSVIVFPGGFNAPPSDQRSQHPSHASLENRK